MAQDPQNGLASLPGTLSAARPHPAWKRLFGISLFGCAMGLLEAICVVYLRRLIVPAGSDPSHAAPPLESLHIEHIREACTVVMLLSVAWMTASNWRSRTAHFVFMFGVWDIIYYVGLKWFAYWPASWIEWDCLFLIPEPWYGPVLAPVLISAYLMLASCLLLVRENSRTGARVSLAGFALQLPGFLVWYWSFVRDSDRIAAHGYAGVSYSWSLFACGLILGLLGLWLAARSGRCGEAAVSVGGPSLPLQN
jgi:hypothetical protein